MKTSLAVVVLVLFPTLALGQSMRCGSKLVSKKMTMAKVEALCGKPTQAVHHATTGIGPEEFDVSEDIWTYNFGPNKLMQEIRFRGGIVESIQSVGHGYRDSK